MSSTDGNIVKRDTFVAKLAERTSSCIFCQRDSNNEIIYGKLYTIGDIHCHYFCVLLSSCLVQNGNNNEGLFGFLYHDILAEVERFKKHKCSYCGQFGATLACGMPDCKIQFHLPCGRERDAVSLFFENYKSFCEKHAPAQRINEEVMKNVKYRLLQRKRGRPSIRKAKLIKKIMSANGHKVDDFKGGITEEQHRVMETVCVICCEAVEGYPTVDTFWPPCCARDAWFHRNCLQRMALSVGVHNLKCPLCNDKETFYRAVLSRGYYVPDRSWTTKLCILCGSNSVRDECGATGNTDRGKSSRYVCLKCLPEAPEVIEPLENEVQQGEVQSALLPSQVMPSRMSLRRRSKSRTSDNLVKISSNIEDVSVHIQEGQDQSGDVIITKLESNLKTAAKASTEQQVLNDMEDNQPSLTNVMKTRKLIRELRKKLNKPKPYLVQNEFAKDILKSSNLLKERISPNEYPEAEVEADEVTENGNPKRDEREGNIKTREGQVTHTRRISEQDVADDCSVLKNNFSKINKERESKKSLCLDEEYFKLQYLNEVFRFHTSKDSQRNVEEIFSTTDVPYKRKRNMVLKFPEEAEVKMKGSRKSN